MPAFFLADGVVDRHWRSPWSPATSVIWLHFDRGRKKPHSNVGPITLTYIAVLPEARHQPVARIRMPEVSDDARLVR